MSRLGAIVAALALVVAGCAPPVVGGTWRTGPVAPAGAGLVAADVTLEFVDGATVRASVVQGGASGCPERYSHSVAGTWLVNANGEVVVNVHCDHEVDHCDRSGGVTRTFNLCGVFDATVYPGRFVTRGDTLASLAQPSIVLTRR